MNGTDPNRVSTRSPRAPAAASNPSASSCESIQIEVHLTRDTIRPFTPFAKPPNRGRDGAWAEFTGLVRREENGHPIQALVYEAYESMAQKVIRSILVNLARQHPCSFAAVIHRLGEIPVGEAAIWVGVASPHRREAFALLTAFMDELKRDVPIWKVRTLAKSPEL